MAGGNNNDSAHKRDEKKKETNWEETETTRNLCETEDFWRRPGWLPHAIQKYGSVCLCICLLGFSFKLSIRENYSSSLAFGANPHKFWTIRPSVVSVTSRMTAHNTASSCNSVPHRRTICIRFTPKDNQTLTPKKGCSSGTPISTWYYYYYYYYCRSPPDLQPVSRLALSGSFQSNNSVKMSW